MRDPKCYSPLSDLEVCHGGVWLLFLVDFFFSLPWELSTHLAIWVLTWPLIWGNMDHHTLLTQVIYMNYYIITWVKKDHHTLITQVVYTNTFLFFLLNHLILMIMLLWNINLFIYFRLCGCPICLGHDPGHSDASLRLSYQRHRSEGKNRPFFLLLYPMTFSGFDGLRLLHFQCWLCPYLHNY